MGKIVAFFCLVVIFCTLAMESEASLSKTKRPIRAKLTLNIIRRRVYKLLLMACQSMCDDGHEGCENCKTALKKDDKPIAFPLLAEFIKSVLEDDTDTDTSQEEKSLGWGFQHDYLD